MLCMFMHAMMRRSHQRHQPAGHEEHGFAHRSHRISPLELLEIRYVKGEITKAEFEEMRQVLAEVK